MTFLNYWMESTTTNTTTTSLDACADNDVDDGDIINGHTSTNMDYDGDIVTGYTVSTDPTLIDYPPMEVVQDESFG